MSATNIPARLEKIKKLMKIRLVKQSDIVNGLHVDKRSVWQCLHVNLKTSDFILKDPYIREGIARYLALPYQTVWGENPEYFNANLRRSLFFTGSSDLRNAIQ